MALACLCGVVLLSGCAYIPPMDTAASYFKELYRRLPYTVEGRYRVITIFTATDRKVEREGDTSFSFRPELGEGLTYGTMDVKIDPQVSIGKMLPDRLKRHGVIGVQDIRRLDADAFKKQLAAAVAASPHRSLLVVIFGYKDDFEVTAIKAAYFAYLLDVNTPVLLFDWPGDQPVSISGYKRAQDYARRSGPFLSELLVKVVRDTKPERLWVQASSLGCAVVCHAFHSLYVCEDFCDMDTEIANVILAAPDVGLKEFDERFKKEFVALSRSLTVYVSSNDDALLLSGMINQEQRLGRQRIAEDDEEAEAKDLLYLKSLEPERITVIDVTPINNASDLHGYYLECPEFFDDLYMRIFDKHPNTNRRLYLLKYKDNVDYWVLQGER